MTCSDNVWIVIPAFNEGEVIGDVVRNVRAEYRRVVVVDDCSSDQTGDIALSSLAVVLRHPVNLGQGAALQTGIRYALSRGAEYIVTFDADGQHQVSDIAILLEKQRTGAVDVVFGSRFLGAATGIPWRRRLFLKLAVWFTRMTSGMRLSDTHNGLRLLTRKAAERIQIHQNRMAHASEIIHQVSHLGLSFAEAPVTIIYTDYSLRKGQRLGNAINILSEILIARVSK